MSDQAPVRLPDERIAHIQRRFDLFYYAPGTADDIRDLLSDRAAILRELEEARHKIDALRFDLNLFAAVLGVQSREDVDAAVTRMNTAIARLTQERDRLREALTAIRDETLKVETG